MRNPVRSEADAFRFVLLTIGYFALIVIGSVINVWLGVAVFVVLTLCLGLTFLLTQVIEYHRLHFNTGDTSFAATFFGLTGLHGAHVFVGLTILLVMTIRAFRGHFSPEHHHGVEIGGIYWHFVDVMWIVVYSTVYLI